jgi:hypothetical protein
VLRQLGAAQVRAAIAALTELQVGIEHAVL